MTTAQTPPEVGGPTMAAEEECPVAVSRRIEADAPTIFAILADPQRHTEIDGSEMLRGALAGSPVTGVGDEFVLNMYLERLGGDYQMANEVVEYEQDRRIAWEPRRHDVDDAPVGGHVWGYQLTPEGENATLVTEIFDCARWPEEDKPFIDYGRAWVEAMTKTLERLDALATGQPSDDRPAT
jgi:hypothetical protein